MARNHHNQQQTLGFEHQTASTSVAAFKASGPKRSTRKMAAENYLLMAGDRGLTRGELADKMDVLLSSVCGLCSPMIAAGLIVECGDTRKTPNGSAAKVMRLPQFSKDRRR